MQRQEKGEFGYMAYRKKMNLIKMLAAFGIVIAVFVAGLIAFKTRNNILTVLSIVLVLPAAKMAVGYFVLLPHKSASSKLYEKTEQAASNLGRCYDLIVSNAKSPIGTLAVVVSDTSVCAFTQEEKADKALFEKSMCDFMKNDGLNVSVTLYKDEKSFISRARSLNSNFENDDLSKTAKRDKNMDSLKSMCL